MIASKDRIVVLTIDADDWQSIVRVMFGHSFGVNVRTSPCTTTPRVGLIVVNRAVVALALLRSGGRSGTLEMRIEGSHVIHLAEPIATEAIVRRVSPRVQVQAASVFNGTSILTDRAGLETEEALAELSAEATNALAMLRAQQRMSHVNAGGVAAVLEEQRDAVALGLEASGLDSLALIPDVDPDPLPIRFLASPAFAAASEASLIRHDAANFSDWTLSQGTIHDVVTFTDPRDHRRRVTIVYADKEHLERVTGTDLIYYREHSSGFVLVQYKRMENDPDAKPGQQWGYRPDPQLQIELDRMRDLRLVSTPSSIDDWRLSAEPFYFKLVEAGKTRPENRRLVPGMYFPLDLFEFLLDSPSIRGPKSGRRIGWHNAVRYLTNTDFLDMLQSGFIGSTGVSTGLLAKVINQTLAQGRGAVVARDETATGVDRRWRS